LRAVANRNTYFVYFDGGIIITRFKEAGHGRVPRQGDLGRLDQHDADIVDRRRLHGSFSCGYGYVNKLSVFGRRQVTDTIFGPHVKLVRGNRTQTAYRYLSIIDHLLEKRYTIIYYYIYIQLTAHLYIGICLVTECARLNHRMR